MPSGYPFVAYGLPHPVAKSIHGYDEKFLEKNGINPIKAYEKFRDYAQDFPLVAHNLAFDWNRALTGEYERLGIDPIGTRGFCTLMLSSCLGACLEGQLGAAVLPIVDVAEAEVREIGNVDLVVKRGNQLIGINTQFLALLSVLGSASELNRRRNAVILGCGEFCKVALCALRRIGLLDITVFSDSLPLLRKLPWARKTTHSSSLDPVDIAIICEANLPIPPLHPHALVLDLTEREGHWERECWFYGAEDLRTWRLWHQARELTGAHVDFAWVRAHK